MSVSRDIKIKKVRSKRMDKWRIKWRKKVVAMRMSKNKKMEAIRAESSDFRKKGT